MKIVDIRNKVVKWIKLHWSVWRFRFRKSVLKKDYQSLSQFKKTWKSRSKNDIIKEMVVESAKLNKTGAYIDPKYKKQLRSRPKNQLIEALAQLKITRQFGGL